MRAHITTIVAASVLVAVSGCGQSKPTGTPEAAKPAPNAATTRVAGTSGVGGKPQPNVPQPATPAYSGPTQHDGAVFDVLFSRDGKTLRSIGADGRVLDWDATTGKVVKEVAQLWADQNSAPAGALLAYGGTIVLAETLDKLNAFDVAKGKWTYSIEPGSLAITRSADTELVGRAANEGNHLRVFDAESGAEVDSIAAPNDNIGAGPAISNDGKTIATTWPNPENQAAAALVETEGTDMTPSTQQTSDVVSIGLTFFDASTGFVLAQNKESVSDWGVFLADGKTFLTRSSWGLTTYDVATAEQIQEIPTGLEASFVCCAPDSRTVAYSIPPLGGIHVVDMASGTQLKTIPIGATVSADAFSPDGSLLAVGDENGKVSFFDAKTFTAK